MEYVLGIIGVLILAAVVRGLVYRSQHPRGGLNDQIMGRHLADLDAEELAKSEAKSQAKHQSQ